MRGSEVPCEARYCAGSRCPSGCASISASSSGDSVRAPGVEVLVELRPRGHADDGAGDAPVRVAEGQRHPRRRQAVLARQRVVAARGGQRFGPAPALLAHATRTSPGGPAASWPSTPGGVVLAGERAEGQRRIRQQRHAAAVHRFVQPVVDARGWSGSTGSAPWRCAAGRAARPGARTRARPTASRSTGRCARTLPARTSVAKASSCSWIDVCCGPSQGRSRAPPKHGTLRFGQWIWYRSMTIGLQPSQAVVARLHDVVARVRSALPSRTHGMPRDGPATLVASTTFSRTPGRAANQLPMMRFGGAVGLGARRHRRTSRRCR